MNEQDYKDLFSGNDEVELTDELIESLVKEKKWVDAKSLKGMRGMGGRWNVKRNSVVFPAEFF